MNERMAFRCLLGIGLLSCSSNTPDGFANGRTKGPSENNSSEGTFGQNPTGSGQGDKNCAAQISEARRDAVDIIMMIDTSSSMDEETAQVQLNINAFAQSIGGSGLDYQVIMIAEKFKPAPFPLAPSEGVCVPAPLAGPNCSDNPPKFRQFNQEVHSNDALKIVIDTYDQWKSWLRPQAWKAFVIVTDDNSAMMDAATFDQALLAKQPAGMFGTTTQRKYVMNPICGWQEGTPPLSPQVCGTAENIGRVYQELAQQTGGTIDSVCKQNYDGVFGNLAKGLVTKIGCEFFLPKADKGEVDPKKVAVKYTRGGAAAPSELEQVTDASKCSAHPMAWHYDNGTSPTKIVFCPQLCAQVSQDLAGRIEIAAGCSVPAPK